VEQEPRTFANAGSRAAGWTIDASICLVATGWAALGYGATALPLSPQGFLLIPMAVTVAYVAFMRATFGGTGGEKALQLRVVSRRGDELPAAQAVARLATGVLLPWLIPYFLCWLQYFGWRAREAEGEPSSGLAMLFFWVLTWLVVVPLWSVLQLLLASSSRGQAIPDLLFQTVVVSEKPHPLAVRASSGPAAPPDDAPQRPQRGALEVLPNPDGPPMRRASFGEHLAATVGELLLLVAAFHMAGWPWMWLPVFLVSAFAVEAALAQNGWHSPGKMAIGLLVVDRSGAPASLLQLTVRASARWGLPMLAFAVGVGRHVIGQTLRDGDFPGIGGWEFAGGWLAVIVWTIAHAVILGASGRAVHDRIAGTAVVRKPSVAAPPGRDLPSPAHEL
jgi:uncharacterized RDD family membrane protein YckC